MLALDPRDDDLYFLPLGGSDEIGMNLNLCGYAGRWLMVDLGITFADDSMPGLDIILPDVEPIVRHRDRLDGLLLTHAHEDPRSEERRVGKACFSTCRSRGSTYN